MVIVENIFEKERIRREIEVSAKIHNLTEKEIQKLLRDNTAFDKMKKQLEANQVKRKKQTYILHCSWWDFKIKFTDKK